MGHHAKKGSTSPADDAPSASQLSPLSPFLNAPATDADPAPAHAVYDDGPFRRLPQLDAIPAHITATSGPPLDWLQRNLETLRAVALGLEDDGVLSADEARLVLERWLHNVRFQAHARQLLDDEGWVVGGGGGWLKRPRELEGMAAWRAEWRKSRFAAAVGMLAREKALGEREQAVLVGRWIGFYAGVVEAGEEGEGEEERRPGAFSTPQAVTVEEYEGEAEPEEEEEYEDEAEPGEEEEYELECSDEEEEEYQEEVEEPTPVSTRAQRQLRKAARGQSEESLATGMRATSVGGDYYAQIGYGAGPWSEVYEDSNVEEVEREFSDEEEEEFEVDY
ncbi:hypothetical protein B0T18DRAFT_403916 [Schizothecium vesticola]|uniref:Uncharacterized protein n=1 Tax=Schizothecium vesticola TaxID=314040 RepID=A0AA40KAG6_9PEZI|nr:hypothetical protein B0T18DRAFT_403916 [Schizothecium vesticola]